MAEIAELKSLSPHTLHQAVTLFDSYLLTRQVHRTALQLLGVTAILVASRSDAPAIDKFRTVCK